MAFSPWQPLNGQRVRGIHRWNSRTPESGGGGVVKVCTVNVGTIEGRSMEVVDMLARRWVSAVCRRCSTRVEELQP